MVTIHIERDLPWLPRPSEVRWVLADELSDPALITSVHVFAFDGDRLLMTDLETRNWDIPGGRIETGETLEGALHREVYEETSAALSRVEVLGYMLIRLLGSRPDGYRYPYPESFIALYRGYIASLAPFEATTEARGRGLFSPNEARQLP
jgi:8-oxo-dGTP diphosphatase